MLAIGHRGAMGHATENTLLSMQKALDFGAKHIELDVFQVSSRALVFHDSRLERLSDGSGWIEEASLDYLRSLDLGRGQTIPFLEEVFELVDARAAINIELKGKDTASLVAESISQLFKSNPKWKPEQLLVSSFDHPELERFAQIMPNIKRGVLYSARLSNPIEYALDQNAYSIHVSHDFLRKDTVEKAHANSLVVFTYTVNNPEEILRVKNLGVDGVFTNYPERVIDSNYSVIPAWVDKNA